MLAAVKSVFCFLDYMITMYVYLMAEEGNYDMIGIGAQKGRGRMEGGAEDGRLGECFFGTSDCLPASGLDIDDGQ